MLNLFAYDYIKEHRDDFARRAQQEHLADRALLVNEGARVVDQSAGDAARHPLSTAVSTVDRGSTTIDPTPVEVRRPSHRCRGRSLVSWRMR
jgi:hypothetical protein